MKTLLFGFLGLLVSCVTLAQGGMPADFARWAEVKTPTGGPTQIYGGFSAGCITGAKQLPVNGKGYTVVRQLRNRFYGHPLLLNYIQNLAARVEQNTHKMLAIEDMGYVRGGPFFTGHASHQVGLDVDISLRLLDGPLSQQASDSYVSPTYVQDRKVLLSNWGVDQIALVPLAANSSEVNRIFVAPAIKQYFCKTNPSSPWLYKLRAWWGHDDHIHVRLSCPADNPHCKSQEPLDPKDNGCGASDLGWWMSKEADQEWAKMEKDTSPRQYPSLPAYCESLVRSR